MGHFRVRRVEILEAERGPDGSFVVQVFTLSRSPDLLPFLRSLLFFHPFFHLQMLLRLLVHLLQLPVGLCPLWTPPSPITDHTVSSGGPTASPPPHRPSWSSSFPKSCSWFFPKSQDTRVDVHLRPHLPCRWSLDELSSSLAPPAAPFFCLSLHLGEILVDRTGLRQRKPLMFRTFGIPV